jgi:hypothetical protein
LSGFGNVLGLFLRETLQRIDRDVAMVFQLFRELRFMQSGTPGGFFERMFRDRDHQKQEVTRANAFNASTEPYMTGDPRLQNFLGSVVFP